MSELYNIRDIKVAITKVLYTPGLNRFRLGSNFVQTSVQNCRFIFCLYSGKIRFMEIGFNDQSVYKMLRYIFKNNNVNKIIINIMEFVTNVVRAN